ncbi:MAG: hypothetical protein HQ579_09155 [Candidatus Omnitrophica bacterium]|nr:hypothetical protein [Candidatus Omnitrophota bacterium]
MPADINPEVRNLDSYKDKVGKFYQYSFERDEVFIKNIDKYSKGEETLFLVTGGFHTESMTTLLKEQGYSYVLITPKIISEKDNPYFHLLAGSLSPIESLVSEYTAALALKSLFSEMGIKTDRVAMKEAVNGLYMLLRGKRQRLVLIGSREGEDAFIEIALRPANYTIDEERDIALGTIEGQRIVATPIGLDETERIESILDEEAVEITPADMDHDALGYVGNEVYDILIKWAMTDTHGYRYLETTIDEQGLAHGRGEGYMDAVMVEFIYPLVTNAQDKQTLIELLRGVPLISFIGREKKQTNALAKLNFALDHASHLGIYITYRGTYKEMAGKALHELGAYYGMSTQFNDELGKAVLAGDSDKVVASLKEIKAAHDRGQRLTEEGQREVAGERRDLAGLGDEAIAIFRDNALLETFAADLEEALGLPTELDEEVIVGWLQVVGEEFSDFMLRWRATIRNQTEAISLEDLRSNPLTPEEIRILSMWFIESRSRLPGIDHYEMTEFSARLRRRLEYIRDFVYTLNVGEFRAGERHPMSEAAEQILENIGPIPTTVAPAEGVESVEESALISEALHSRRKGLFDRVLIAYQGDDEISGMEEFMPAVQRAIIKIGRGEAIVDSYQWKAVRDVTLETRFKEKAKELIGGILTRMRENPEELPHGTIFAPKDTGRKWVEEAMRDVLNDYFEQNDIIDGGLRNEIRTNLKSRIHIINMQSCLYIDVWGHVSWAVGGAHELARIENNEYELDLGEQARMLGSVERISLELLRRIVASDQRVTREILYAIIFTFAPLRSHSAEDIDAWKTRQRAIDQSL